MTPRTRRSTWIIPLVAPIAIGSAGCDVILGTNFDRLRRRPSTCSHAVPPEPPPPSENPGNIEFVLANRAENFGDLDTSDAQPGYQTVGWDLDHTCTGNGEPSSCREPTWATADNTDGDDGIDNAVGRLFTELRPFGTATAAAQLIASLGHKVTLFRLSGYNGQANDDRVQAEYLIGTNLVTEDGSGPRWDGTDEWRVSAYTLEADQDGHYDVTRGAFVDDKAYVSGWTLVIRLPTIPLSSPLQGRYQKAYDFVFAGELAKDDQGRWWIPKGVSASRNPAREALGTFGGFDDPYDPGHPLCINAKSYRDFKTRTCAHVDISAKVDDPSNPCDALSTGTVVTVVPAILGPVDESEIQSTRCAPDVDPANDSCDRNTALASDAATDLDAVAGQ